MQVARQRLVGPRRQRLDGLLPLRGGPSLREKRNIQRKTEKQINEYEKKYNNNDKNDNRQCLDGLLPLRGGPVGRSEPKHTLLRGLQPFSFKRSDERPVKGNRIAAAWVFIIIIISSSSSSSSSSIIIVSYTLQR